MSPKIPKINGAAAGLPPATTPEGAASSNGESFLQRRSRRTSPPVWTFPGGIDGQA